MIDQTLAPQRPLFLVQDAPPGEEHLAMLAARLAAHGPVHCLRAETVDGLQPVTVEGMAAVVVQAVRRVQPAGPYRLAGCGFGGLLAYETAIQLIGLDAPVELVALVDTPCPQGPQLSGPTSSHAQAIADYLVQRISVPIDLFVHAGPSDAPGAARDPLLGWGGLLPREMVRVSPVPGPSRSTQAADVDA
ncbi:thioesterase domain-containing protein, partial [Ramlibacter sp.]|uniref:thioesterase domain-containing protein n=1 Tax=Ramlibacter sp. TaxID=1917967 RepID=UPI0017A434D0